MRRSGWRWWSGSVRVPDAWKRDLEAWQALGASHFSMRAMSTGTKLIGEKDPGFTDPRQHIVALETFMREVS